MHNWAPLDSPFRIRKQVQDRSRLHIRRDLGASYLGKFRRLTVNETPMRRN